MRRTGAAVLGLALALGAAAQQRGEPEVRVSSRPYALPPPLLHAQTTLVTLDVVVRRPDGTLVTGLTQPDFTILDDGQPRSVAAFSLQKGPAPPKATLPDAPRPNVAAATAPAAPRSVAIYFDDVNTANGDLTNARKAALRYLREDSGAADHTAIMTASGEQTLGFTTDRNRLLTAVAAIRIHPRKSDSIQPCPRITAYQAYLITALNDPMALQAAVDEAANCPGSSPTDDLTGQPLTQLGLKGEWAHEPILAQAGATWEQASQISDDTLAGVRTAVASLARQPAPRMLLMASGGFLSGGYTLEEQQDRIIQGALHSNVIINSLDAKGLYTDGPGRPLSEATDSGTLPLSTFIFEETSKMSVRMEQDAAMIKLAQSTGGLFFHDNNDLTLGFERLGMIQELTYELAFVPGDIPHDGKYHKLRVRVASPAKVLVQARPGYFAPPPALSATAIAEAMDAAMRSSTAQADLPAQIGWKPDSGGERVYIRLDAGQLPFTNEKGRRRLRLLFVAGLFDQQGVF
ncbi:MAG: VWA domain-containing protein, partial [Terriglobales bacterium]